MTPHLPYLPVLIIQFLTLFRTNHDTNMWADGDHSDNDDGADHPSHQPRIQPGIRGGGRGEMRSNYYSQTSSQNETHLFIIIKNNSRL